MGADFDKSKGRKRHITKLSDNEGENSSLFPLNGFPTAVLMPISPSKI